MSNLLIKPTIPIKIEEADTVASLLGKMGSTGFQGRNLSSAANIWREMLAEGAFIIMGLAGAMVPAGMRRLLAFLIEKRYIHCLVSTGANLFHDIHESLGFRHYLGSPLVDDLELRREKIDRIYDIFASDKEFGETDSYVNAFTRTLSFSRAYSTREYFHLLGRRLGEDGKEKGILTSAAEAGIPVYCPAVGDSSIGIAIAAFSETRPFLFDATKDVYELARIVFSAESTGVVYVGGGTPKNFVQQAHVTAAVMGKNVAGHKYAIQITVDAPHWGGLSGCTFDEGQSWGKVAENAPKVTVFCDATIALPILTTALAQNESKKRLSIPLAGLDVSGENLAIGE